jgi:hypothetical protein
MLWIHRLGAALALATTAGCGAGRDCCGPPPTGTLHVTTVTTGVNLDPDGSTVVTRPQIFGRDSLSRPIGINETITWELEPATHTVRLSGVESNCAITNDNPRSVTVSVNASAFTTFEVSCNEESPDESQTSPIAHRPT